MPQPLPILAVYFDDPNPMGYPFGEPEYLESYWTFSQKLLARGFATVIVRGPDSYLGNMQFTGGYTITSESTIEPYAGPFTAALIYRKGYKLVTAPTDRVVNHQAMEPICTDKLETYRLFSDVMAPCFPMDANNWRDVVQKITTDKIVVKPVYGQEGNGIVVLPKAEFNFEILDQKQAPFFAQEFVDSSAGIPGVVEGLHDLRLYVFNGQVKMAEVRRPKQGSFLANIAQGGNLFQVRLEDVPQSALDCAARIDATFAAYSPRIYTVDLMYQKDQPYLVELNSQPGLPWREWEQYDHCYTKLHSFVIDALLS